jgi:hypothetical protein
MKTLLVVILDLNCEVEIIKHLSLFIHAYLSLGTNQVLFIGANTGGNTILYPRKEKVEIAKEGNVYKQFHDFDVQLQQTLPIALQKQSNQHPKISGALALGLTCFFI